jgi:glycosyltransferase involved in cell wall biosynthesis
MTGRAVAAPRRVSLLAFHFAEYSARLALGLAEHARVQLVLDRAKLVAEAPGLLAELDAAGVRTVAYEHGSAAAKLLSGGRALAAIAAFRPHLVVAHEHAVPAPAMITAAAARLAPLRLIVHDPQPHAGADAKVSQATDRFRRLGRDAAADYAVHGRFCTEQMGLAQPRSPKPVRAIAHGVLSPPTAAERRAPVPNRALFFGRLELYKGFDTLFAAADRVAAELPDFTLQILGRGSELERVRALAAERPYVELLAGYAPPEQVVAAMQQASVVVLPYDEGTQSGVLSIAFANARPVVATAVGALQEVVTEANGVLVRPKDPAALAGAMLHVLRDETAWARLSAGAAETAATAMDWRAVASALLEPAAA